ncbi:HEPN domain-containing protein [Sinomicrobium sp.]
MNANTQKIVHRIVNLVKVEYIYHFVTGEEENRLEWILVLYPEGTLNLQQDQKEVISKILEDRSGCVIRFYSLQYALRQLREGNLFFLRVYDGSNLVYNHTEDTPESLMDDISPEEALQCAESRFKRDIDRVKAFKAGAGFYADKKDFSQALFMIHQAMELGLRLIEIMLVGKERVCHNIQDHLKYIKTFIPELDSPFSDGEDSLLRLLNSAYKGVRYDNDIKVSEAQITLLNKKAKKLIQDISNLFDQHLQSIRYRFSEILETSDNFYSSKQLRETRERIKELLQKTFFKHDQNSSQVYYKGHLPISSPQEVLDGISSLIALCIMALHNTDNSEPSMNTHLKRVLEMAVTLLPYEAMQCLEELVGNDNIDKHIPSISP